MRKSLYILLLLFAGKALQAQTRPPYIYTIKADSVLITNSCDTAELILENHTQNVPGFLFNKGGGRTEFRRPLQKVSDSIYLIGNDTLRLSGAWLQGGNTFGTTGILGTRDNNHIDFITNNTPRSRLTNTGNLLLGTTVDNGNTLQVNGNISLVNGNSDIKSPRFPVLIGDEGTGGGTAFLFEGDGTGRRIIIGGENSNNFHKFLFQTRGQAGDSIANYNFIYNSNAAHALNIFNAADGLTKLLLTAPGNLLLNTTTDNGFKLQVSGNVYADGNLHKIGKLAIASGSDVGSSGFGTGIRIDDSSYGSMMFQGTPQGWAKDMFVFTDAYGGIGQDVYFPDQSLVRIRSGIKSNNSAGNSANALNISPEYKLNTTTDLPLTLRGIYYNPKLTSIVAGSKHIAIETVSGDVLIGTTSGNVGIGTSAPSAQLHTTGTVRFGGLTSDSTQSRVIVSDANGNLFYRSASSLALNDVMNSDLAINGTLSAQKMKITQTGPWPDYVFSNQYKLPTLLQLEQYIKQNNHLPDVPSAAEVDKKGIDVGNNQAILLKKVEELTLYAIEQEKKLQQQNEQMAKQSEEIAEMKKQLKVLMQKN
jgi:hypothetical protein